MNPVIAATSNGSITSKQSNFLHSQGNFLHSGKGDRILDGTFEMDDLPRLSMSLNEVIYLCMDSEKTPG